jgi:hypothetical protein
MVFFSWKYVKVLEIQDSQIKLNSNCSALPWREQATFNEMMTIMIISALY